MQPCVRAGRRSATLLPVNRRSSHVLTVYVMFDILGLLLLSSRLPPPTIPLLYDSLLYPPYLKIVITQVPPCESGWTSIIGIVYPGRRGMKSV